MISIIKKLLRYFHNVNPPRRTAGLLITPGEPPIRMFVSSVMNSELQWARDEVKSALQRDDKLYSPWLFEYTPASSEQVEKGYLRNVQEADFVLWLVGRETTQPVRDEIAEALSKSRKLIVIKLPVNGERSPETESLINQVGVRAKWATVDEDNDLRTILLLSVNDELIRSVRLRPDNSRVATLESLARESLGRCVARWQAVGVLSRMATDLAEDNSIVISDFSEVISRQTGLTIVLGEIGAGKSLLAERLHQQAIRDFRTLSDTRIPVYVEAREIKNSLKECILSLCTNLGDPSSQGVTAIIDGADEVTTDRIERLVFESRVLCNTWIGSRVTLTSRPIFAIEKEEGAYTIQPLSKPDINSIFARVSGKVLTPMLEHSLPAAVKEAVQRPLFAVALALLARDGSIGTRRTETDLLRYLVEKANNRSYNDLDAHIGLYRKLAITSLSNETPWVSINEIANIDERSILIQSRLLTINEGKARFSLQIFAEWYAAESIALSSVNLGAILGDSRRAHLWRYAIKTAIQIADEVRAKEIISTVVTVEPALAATILSDLEYGNRKRTDCDLGDSHLETTDCGSRFLGALHAWRSSLGDLFRFIVPLSENDEIDTIGIGVNGNHLIYAFQQMSPDTTDKNPSVPYIDVGSNFATVRYWNDIHMVADVLISPMWEYEITFSIVKDKIKKLIQARSLLPQNSTIEKEVLWSAALLLTRKGSLYDRPIPLGELESAIARRDAYFSFAMQDPEQKIERLRQFVSNLRARSIEHLEPPWPVLLRSKENQKRVADKQSARDEFARFCSSALVDYNTLVVQWFPRLRDSMPIAAFLPAKIVVELVERDEADNNTYPHWSWYLLPMEKTQTSTADVSMVETTTSILKHEEIFDRIRVEINKHRYKNRHVVSPSYHRGLSPLRYPLPTTELVYRWLESDLKSIKFID